MKVLESLSNLFRKRTPATAPAGAEGVKEPVQISRNTTIWVIVASLLLAVAVGAGIWWWKARHKAAAPTAVAHMPAKAIVNAPPVLPVAEPVHEEVVAQSQSVHEAVSAVPVATPPAESASHEAKAKPTHVAASPPAALDVPKKSPSEEEKIAPSVALKTLGAFKPSGALKSSGAIEPAITVKPSGAVESAVTVESHGAAKPQVSEKKKTHIHVVRQEQEAHAESKAAVVAGPVVADQAVTGLVAADLVVADRAGSMDKRVKPVSVQQQADNEFRKGVGYMQQGHINDALAAYEVSLKLDPGHDAARQAMVALLLESRRIGDAERVLREGVKANPRQSAFAMLLARLQIERGVPWSALLTLQDTLPYAKQQADYQAFMAALLQRLEHHQEAVAHYQAALQITPNSGLWLMGLGLSLQSLQREDEARDAFRRATETHSLSADLQDFVTQRLKEL